MGTRSENGLVAGCHRHGVRLRPLPSDTWQLRNGERQAVADALQAPNERRIGSFIIYKLLVENVHKGFPFIYLRGGIPRQVFLIKCKA